MSNKVLNGPSASSNGNSSAEPVPTPPTPTPLPSTSKVPKPRMKRPAPPPLQAKIKRKRTPTDTYQSHIVAAAQQTRGLSLPVEKKEVYYNKGDYLAVRNEAGSYYICQTAHNVYKSTKIFKVRWFELENPPDVYGVAYYDTIEMDSVLTDIAMERRERDKFFLPRKERDRIDLILDKAKQKEEGKLDEQEEARILAIGMNDINDGYLDDEEGEEDEEMKEDRDYVIDDDDEDDEDMDIEESPKPSVSTGRRGRPPKVRPTIKAKLVVKGKRGRPPGSKNKSKKKKRGKPGRKPKLIEKKSKKHKMKEIKVKDVNRKLKPNNAIEIVSKDPAFEVRNECDMPEISPLFKCKKAIRAVLTNDMKLLKDLIDDPKNVAGVFVNRSVDLEYDALTYAISQNNQQAVKLLAADIKEPKTDRVELPESLLEAQSTGSYNFLSLGHAVRSISQSRGSREGNNAFTKESGISSPDSRSYVRFAMEKGVNKAMFNLLVATLPRFKESCFDMVHIAVQNGHHKLAGHIIEMAEKSGGRGFNFLHKEVLLNDNEELSPFKSVSVRKKPIENNLILPLHCAAINPNVKYLTKLLAALPDYSAPDRLGRKPIHYAAASEGTATLELLLSRGMNPEETDNMCLTPLMVAAKTGRVHNIEILAKKIKDSKNRDEDGGGFQIDRTDRATYTALHYAAENGHVDVVRALVKHGADVEKVLSAGRNKMTPVMLAARKGYLPTVKALIDVGAAVEKRDKLKRTALIHAVMNGHYPVVCYLLRKGANPNVSDSSGNTAAHYAAGYGWWYCLKVLLAAGSDINTPNDWKTTPLGIAVMQGNTGCADLILEQEGVDVNFRDENGCTMVMLVCGSTLGKGLTSQLKYLVQDKKADVTLTDINKNNALHHVACNNIKVQYWDTIDTKKVSVSLDVAKILLDNGCNPSTVNTLGETPIAMAIQQNNTKLVQLLVDRGGKLLTEDSDISKIGENILHIMAKQCMANDLSILIETFVKTKSGGNDCGDGDKENSVLHKMSMQKDKEGFTPLLRCAAVYADFNPEAQHSKNESERQKMMENGRAMLKVFIEKIKADVNCQVGKREKILDTEEDYNTRGLQSISHVLISTNEKPVKEGDKTTDRPALSMILKHEPNLNLRDKDGNTPLLLAIHQKNKNAAEMLISAGADVNAASENEKEDGKSLPIILAAREGLYGIVTKIINKGTNVNAVDCRNDKTALHFTCSYITSGHETASAVRSLIEAGADVNAMDNKLCTPLHYAVNSNTGGPDSSVETEEILLEKGANPLVRDKYNRLPLHYALVKMGEHTDKSQLDPIEVVSLLTKAMNDKGVDSTDKYGQSVLHRAAFRGAAISCLHITTHKAKWRIDLDQKDNHGNTPLGLAVQAGHDSCAILLIQNGACTNINIVYPPEKVSTKDLENEEGKPVKPIWKYCPTILPPPKPFEYSLFHKVVENGWQGVVFLLMEQWELKRYEYASAVNSALEAYAYQLVSSMLRKQKDHSRLQVIIKKARNLLHTLALTGSQDTDEHVQDQCLKIGADLLTHGLKLTVRDVYGCTPIHYLAVMQNNKLLKLFLEKCASQVKECVTIADNKGRLPIISLLWDSVFDEQTKDMIKLLIENGATLNCAGVFPKIEYKIFQDQNITGYDAEEWFVSSAAGQQELTPLIVAIHRKNFQAIKFLLQNGADVNYCDKNKMSPLMHAAKQGDIENVKLLLDTDYEMKVVAATTQGFRYGVFGRRPLHSNRLRGTHGAVPPVSFGLYKSVSDDNSNEDSDNEDEDEDEEHEESMEEEEEEEEKDKDEKKEKFEKKSSVDLAAVDNQGRTVMHHIMKTCDFGTYENTDILQLLFDVGAALNVNDDKGKSPLDYALNSHSVKMATMIQKLLKSDVLVKPSVVVESCNDGIKWDTEMPDFREDAQQMIKEYTEAETTEMEVEETKEKEEKTDESGDKNDNAEETVKKPTTKKVPMAEIDKLSELQNNGEVLVDKSQGIPYDVLLTKVDVNYGKWGMNNFYKMQLIHQKGKEIYVLFTRWGRIGDEGNFQRTPFQKTEDGIREFCKIFKSKTGNLWSQVSSFEKKPKKYSLVKSERRRIQKKTLTELDINLKSDIPSKLPDDVKDVYEQLTSFSMLKAALRNTNVNTSYMPFGRIPRDVLEQAREILNRIRPLVDEVEKQQDEGFPDLHQYQETMEKVADLSSEYFQLVPSANYVYEELTPLNEPDALKAEVNKINNLLDLEVASRVLLGAQLKAKEINPLDYVYRSTDCQMKVLDKHSLEAQHILKYIQNTCSGRVRVQGIFTLQRQGEAEKLNNCDLDNHMLLWHGTSPANLISILMKGLLVAPAEAPVTGYMFGKGIYTSDTFQKSEAYCHSYGSKSLSSKFMLLTEVALGKVKEYTDCCYMESAAKGSNSTKGLGEYGPDSKHNLLTPSGVIIPQGEKVMNKHPQKDECFNLTFNEYIVYNEDQVCLRYLVMFDS
ncbi:poly [ADP-ribose] polymerase tankyrase-like [Saccoglossus kowalevskii]|uniref:Poly [ADP-ribose] polymerase n=1 Tax=Saccoglossus kowalevskii TaxID=10224 RepID=A0ABM0MFW7_SACKO|nr:PREDICTED: poly(ADP-ribose) polymerase pme-5-like [Saccoglossus kowalevskii]